MVKEGITQRLGGYTADTDSIGKRLNYLESIKESRTRYLKRNGLSVATNNPKKEVDEFMKDNLNLNVNIVDCSKQDSKFLIVNVYLRSDNLIGDLEKFLSIYQGNLIGGDFNARIGTLNQLD